MVPPTCPSKKKFRWIARVRTWSSPPSSARISSILLDAPFSKCQGLTRKYYGPTIQPTTLTTPTNPSTQQTYPPTPPKTFNHEGGVPQKSSENKNVPEWSTARGRTWSSSPSSARTSSKHEKIQMDSKNKDME